MKILQVNKFYYPVIGGIERIVQLLAEGLCGKNRCDRKDAPVPADGAGANVRVLACQQKGATTQTTVNGVPVVKASSLGVAFSMPVSLSFFYWFNRLKKDRDILHLHLPFPLGDIALRLFDFKGKVVLSWHSDIVRQKRFMFFYKPFLKWTLQRADLIIVATQGHIDGSDYLSAHRDKCVIIPYGVVPYGDDGVSAVPSIKTHLPTKNAAPPRAINPAANPTAKNGPVSFLFTGRLVGYKGCGVLLDALAKTVGTELVIIGEGPLENSLKEQTKELGIEERVRFLGGVSDDVLAQALADCDVFVLPSIQKNEAFGLVQAEAMAYDKPVINTWLPSGVPYVSLNGVTGLTVPPSDPAALAQAMQKLTDDPALRIAYGEAAGRRAREEYAVTVMLDRVFAQYMRLSHA